MPANRTPNVSLFPPAAFPPQPPTCGLIIDGTRCGAPAVNHLCHACMSGIAACVPDEAPAPSPRPASAPCDVCDGTNTACPHAWKHRRPASAGETETDLCARCGARRTAAKHSPSLFGVVKAAHEFQSLEQADVIADLRARLAEAQREGEGLRKAFADLWGATDEYLTASDVNQDLRGKSMLQLSEVLQRRDRALVELKRVAALPHPAALSHPHQEPR